MDRLNIGITGMSGFIGSALANFFTQQGYAVKPIKRNFTPSDLIEFNVIINLAGKNINCNWNNTNKREILESRVTTTRHIINSLTYRDWETDRKSTRLNSSHSGESRMPSSA